MSSSCRRLGIAVMAVAVVATSMGRAEAQEADCDRSCPTAMADDDEEAV